MLRDLIQHWWLLHVRGLFAVTFGVFLLFLVGTMQGLFTTPIAVVGVMFMFVFYIIASGALSIAAAFRSFGGRHRFWAAVVHGTVMLALGSWVLFSNQITVMWLIWLTVANALGSGLLEIALARALRTHLDSILLIIGGTISISSAMLLITLRNGHLSTLISVLGGYAVFYGTVLIIFSLRLLSISRHSHLAHHH